MSAAPAGADRRARLADAVEHPRFALAAALAGIVVVLACGYRAMRSAHRPQGYDQTAYIDGARALLDGVDPYTLDGAFSYLYPPPFALLMVPATWLPTWLLVVLWTAALTVIVIAVGRFALGEFAALRPDRRLAAPALLAALAAVPMFRALHANFANGQVNLFLVGLAVAFVAAVRAGRSAAAGLWLALAIAIKLTPAILGAFLLVRRDWRTIAWTGLWAAGLAVAPALVAGIDGLGELWQAFYREVVVARGAESGPVHDAAGGAMFFTLWGLVSFVAPPLGEIRAVGRLAALCVVAAVVAAHLWTLRATRRDGRDRAATVVALYLLAILLISPMAQKHHLVLMLPAILLGTCQAFARGARDHLGIALWLVVTVGLLGAKAWQSGPLYVIAILAAGVLTLRAARPAPVAIESRTAA